MASLSHSAGVGDDGDDDDDVDRRRCTCEGVGSAPVKLAIQEPTLFCVTTEIYDIATIVVVVVVDDINEDDE